MLEIIIGRAGTGKTYKCLESMKALLDRKGLNARIFLLMPAYMTYQTERQFAEMTNGQTNTYAYSFQRFARQILAETGGANVPKITDIGRRILLRKILMQRDKAQELKYFARAVKQRGFSEILSDTIKELRTYGITPELLRQATAKVDDEELNNKSLDLAMLTEDFCSAIEGKNYDDEDILEMAAAQIKNSNLCKGAEIYIDGVIFFDKLQRKIISELLMRAQNIHITLPMDTNLNSAENKEEIGLFRQSMKTFNVIKNIADEAGVKIQITRCEKNYRFKRGALKFFEQNMFDFPLTSLRNESETDSIKLIEAANQRVEVEAIAQDLLKLKEERGYKFRDIGILYRDEHYTSLIKPVFEIHEIPYYNDEKRQAIHHPLAELIRSSLDLLSSRRADPLFYCLRTGLFDIAMDDVDFLENYIVEFGIGGLKSWKRDEPWGFYRREYESSSNEIPEKERMRLERVNNIRLQVMDYFCEYLSNLDKKSLPVRTLAESLFELLESLRVPHTLNKWSRQAAQSGDLPLSREHLTIWNEIVKLLEQFVEIMGEETITVKEFTSLINEGIEAIQMALIPQGLDEVTIARLDQNSLQNAKAIYILGVSEGQMPRISNEKGLFSDAERYYLGKAGLEIHAGQIENSLAEKFLLYRGFTETREYLCLSYPLADSEGGTMRKAPLIENLQKLIPNIKLVSAGIEILGSNADVLFLVDDKKISPDAAVKLFATYKKTVNSSVSRVEQFMSCPFKHFAQYGLKLEERRERKFRSLDLGNLLHSTMRCFGERLKKENRSWADVGKEEVVTIVDEIFDDLIPNFLNKILLSSNAYKYQKERIRKVAIRSIQRLTELDAESHFHPEKFEVSFGLPDGLDPLSFNLDNGNKLNLSGRIDRIDYSEDGKYFMIIDYKTSDHYINLVDVYYGLNLQLLTYLYVVNGWLPDRLPAAMLYCILKYSPATNSKKITDEEAQRMIEDEFKLPGWVLADPQVIRNIDKSLNFIKVSLNSSGEISGTSVRYGHVKTAKEFELLLNHVEKTLQAAGNRITGGDIAVKPYKNKKQTACDWCPYSAVCGFDPSFKNNSWQNITGITAPQVFKMMSKDMY
ncbi:MAG: PD-(D/E)XK nuclease family protein [Selenomonadaceae bacterium]|nr:PD-(D/E)XK nuclease family protein [Selenomonadaceae bacterium]